jgi:NADPH:quinone reductase
MLTGRDREHHGQILREVAALVDAGALTPLPDNRVFGLGDIEEAHALVAAGKAQGKDHEPLAGLSTARSSRLELYRQAG